MGRCYGGHDCECGFTEHGMFWCSTMCRDKWRAADRCVCGYCDANNHDALISEVVALLEALRRMAADPMKSMDAGMVIDAQRVDELCEDMLDKLRTT